MQGKETHEELLKRYQGNGSTLKVIRLHEPLDFQIGELFFTTCQGCEVGYYPCPTIQALNSRESK